MLPRLRGAWGPWRRVALVVVPAVLGALLLLTGDRPSPGTSRLEATQGLLPDLLFDAPAPSTTVAAAPAGPEAGSPPSTSADPFGPAPALAASAGSADSGPTTTAAAGPTSTGGSPAAAESTAAPTASSGASEGPASGSPATTTTAVPVTTTATTPPATTTTTAAPSGPVRTPGVAADVVPLTNRDRNAAGLGSLSRSSCLDAVASDYAQKLAVAGVLAHNPGAGAAVTDCRPGAAWGDNVGTSLPCSASLLEERWMASPSHRHNILTAAFQHIGVGAWTDAAGACWVQVLFSS